MEIFSNPKMVFFARVRKKVKLLPVTQTLVAEGRRLVELYQLL